MGESGAAGWALFGLGLVAFWVLPEAMSSYRAVTLYPVEGITSQHSKNEIESNRFIPAPRVEAKVSTLKQEVLIKEKTSEASVTRLRDCIVWDEHNWSGEMGVNLPIIISMSDGNAATAGPASTTYISGWKWWFMRAQHALGLTYGEREFSTLLAFPRRPKRVAGESSRKD